MTSSTFRQCLNISPYLSIDYINFPQSWYVSNRYNITRYLYNIRYLFPISFAKYTLTLTLTQRQALENRIVASLPRLNTCLRVFQRRFPAWKRKPSTWNCSMDAHCFSVEIRLFSVDWISYISLLRRNKRFLYRNRCRYFKYYRRKAEAIE